MAKIGSDKFEALRSVAMEKGGFNVGRGLIWKISGKCQSPVSISYTKEKSIRRGLIDLVVPCRHCVWCLKKRAWLWTVRGVHEWAKNERTWFGTLTFHPDQRGKLLASCNGLATEHERRRALVKAAGQLLEKYIKRLRKAGLKFTYMAVAELHKDGMVHFHLLVHGDETIKWRQLAPKWTYGFSQYKLVTGVPAIRYVTKYLAKGSLARVRASRSYGIPPSGDSRT